MVFALLAVQPRDYTVSRHDLDNMRWALAQISHNKRFALRWAGGLFLGGCVTLAVLVIALVLGA